MSEPCELTPLPEDPQKLTFSETVQAMQDPNRPPHFLAMDQSEGTHRKHMQQFGVPIGDEADFQEKAKAARVMLATTPGLNQYFGAAIVHDDLFSLVGPDGKPLQDSLRDSNVLVIGKKLGLDKNTGLATELDQLCVGMRELVEKWGVHLIKTRTTITCGKGHADDAADQMVQVQRKAAKNGQMMAILEPEFAKDNAGTLQENEELMTRVLGGMIDGISREGLSDHPYAIKTSFPAPGSASGERIIPEASAEAWQRICERAEIPEELLVVFLSGGHSPETSRSLLQAMAKVRGHTGSSFSRANVERPYQQTFPKPGGIDIPAGHDAMLLEGWKNRRAMQGNYHPSLEKVQRYTGMGE
ncbi:MAG: class I fructose-bisphosphate aldolase [Candidatus Peribacter sp.]|nr:class I fructose-bisphosphate aldolase [Candidatus Peribacter sp.]